MAEQTPLERVTEERELYRRAWNRSDAFLKKAQEENESLRQANAMASPDPINEVYFARALDERDALARMLEESRRKSESLESRYTALVTASRDVLPLLESANAVMGPLGREELAITALRDALGALLDSEASQGGSE